MFPSVLNSSLRFNVIIKISYSGIWASVLPTHQNHYIKQTDRFSLRSFILRLVSSELPWNKLMKSQFLNREQMKVLKSRNIFRYLLNELFAFNFVKKHIMLIFKVWLISNIWVKTKHNIVFSEEWPFHHSTDIVVILVELLDTSMFDHVQI